MTWAGLKTSDLQELEQFLTRHQNRTDLFGGADPDIAPYGHGGVAGRVVDSAYKFLARRDVPVPTRKTLSEVVRTRTGEGVKQNVLSKFLAGHATAGTQWFKYSRDVLWFLMLGLRGGHTPPPPEAGKDDHTRYKVAKRVDEFFYRDFDDESPDLPTPFFRPERMSSRAPFTRGELSLELMWYGRHARRTGRPVEMVWVSGGQPFFVDPTRRVGKATAVNIGRGVAVSFVYHSGAHRDSAKENVGQFHSAHQQVKGSAGSVREIDLAAPAYQRLSGWWSFCSPAFTFLYLNARMTDGKTDETLYLLRGGAPTGSICVEANTYELIEFKSYWQRVKFATVGVEPAGPAEATTSRG